MMARLRHYLLHVAIAAWVFFLALHLVGGDPDQIWRAPASILVGLYSAALADGVRLPRLVWQSPSLFRNSGLFLKLGDRRWRLLRVSSR